MIRFLAIIKVSIQRSLSYMSLISAGSLLFLVADKLKEYGINYNVFYLAPIIFIASIIFCLLLGWIDLASGIYKEELRWGTQNNPLLMEIKQEIASLKNDIDKLSEKLQESGDNEHR